MTKYDYRAAVCEDIRNYISENYADGIEQAFTSAEEAAAILHDHLWVEDSVTGNGSGSYTFNAWQAEENLAHNWDLIQEVADEFGIDEEPFSKGAEYWDVSIRCYLLPVCLEEVLEDYDFDTEEEEDEE